MVELKQRILDVLTTRREALTLKHITFSGLGVDEEVVRAELEQLILAGQVNTFERESGATYYFAGLDRHNYVHPGGFVVVRRGRKLRHGTIGLVNWVGDSGYGKGVGLRTMHGQHAFTALKNVESYWPSDAERQHLYTMLWLAKQAQRAPYLPRCMVLLEPWVHCRFCKVRYDVRQVTAEYEHLRACQKTPRELLPRSLRYARKARQ